MNIQNILRELSNELKGHNALIQIQVENVLYKAGEGFILTGNTISFRRTQLENIVCCSVLSFGITIFSRFLHPSKDPALFILAFVKKLNEEKSLILVLPLNIVPMGLKQHTNTVLIPSGLCLQTTRI